MLSQRTQTITGTIITGSWKVRVTPGGKETGVIKKPGDKVVLYDFRALVDGSGWIRIDEGWIHALAVVIDPIKTINGDAAVGDEGEPQLPGWANALFTWVGGFLKKAGIKLPDININANVPSDVGLKIQLPNWVTYSLVGLAVAVIGLLLLKARKK